MSEALFYEDGIVFDSDDPDFINQEERDLHKRKLDLESSVSSNYYSDDCLRSNMSCGLVQNNPFSFTNNWLNRSESVESLDSRFDSVYGMPDPDCYHSHHSDYDSFATLEEIRCQLNSCFSCGVNWSDNHVSLDCKECGGYSLKRPCPLCDGKCQTNWHRDISMSHNIGKAHWEGKCNLIEKDRPSIPSFLAEDILIQGFEDLSTSS